LAEGSFANSTRTEEEEQNDVKGAKAKKHKKSDEADVENIPPASSSAAASGRNRRRQEEFKKYDPDSIQGMILAVYKAVPAGTGGIRWVEFKTLIKEKFPGWVRGKEENAARVQREIDERIAREQREAQEECRNNNNNTNDDHDHDVDGVAERQDRKGGKRDKKKATDWECTIRQVRSKMNGLYVEKIDEDTKGNDNKWCLRTEYIAWLEGEEQKQ
jgi:hypothetical protein